MELLGNARVTRVRELAAAPQTGRLRADHRESVTAAIRSCAICTREAGCNGAFVIVEMRSRDPGRVERLLFGAPLPSAADLHRCRGSQVAAHARNVVLRMSPSAAAVQARLARIAPTAKVRDR